MIDPNPRVFLDSTVLFAAAIGGGCVKLWNIPTIQLVTSEYAARETWDVLQHEPAPDKARERLAELLSGLELIPHVGTMRLRTTWTLPDPADIPIMLGAIDSKCGYLLTADAKCFGSFFGKQIEGVMILKPGKFLDLLGL